MKETEERLDLIKEYELKLSESTKSNAIVESEDKPEEKKEELVEKDGVVTLSESMYDNFNKELRERVR